MTDRIRIKEYEQTADDKVSVGGIKWQRKWDVCIQCNSVEEAHALRERLAQPEQEPFGYFQLDLRLDAWVQNRDSKRGVAFYTTPQPRQWQGLTDEERDSFWKADQMTGKEWEELFNAIEAKLREKNGGAA